MAVLNRFVSNLFY